MNHKSNIWGLNSPQRLEQWWVGSGQKPHPSVRQVSLEMSMHLCGHGPLVFTEFDFLMLFRVLCWSFPYVLAYVINLQNKPFQGQGHLSQAQTGLEKCHHFPGSTAINRDHLIAFLSLTLEPGWRWGEEDQKVKTASSHREQRLCNDHIPGLAFSPNSTYHCPTLYSPVNKHVSR